MANRHVLLIGGYAAGKTSYLARVWLEIEGGQCSLKLRNRPNDEQYLMAISNHLINGNFPPRTDQGTTTSCTIPLSNSDHGDFDLVLPDLSGEQWEDLYEKREWKFDSLINEECTCVIFLRADKIVPMLSYYAQGTKYAASDELTEEETTDGRKNRPTELLTVEWLQMLRSSFTRQVGRKFAPRIALALTAWDALPAERQSDPMAFIDKEMPLLSQFLRNNGAEYDCRLFGLSATGGDLKNSQDHREKFKKKPCDHGYVYQRSTDSYYRLDDVIAPLNWGAE